MGDSNGAHTERTTFSPVLVPGLEQIRHPQTRPETKGNQIRRDVVQSALRILSAGPWAPQNGHIRRLPERRRRAYRFWERKKGRSANSHIGVRRLAKRSEGRVIMHVPPRSRQPFCAICLEKQNAGDRRFCRPLAVCPDAWPAYFATDACSVTIRTTSSTT